VKLGFPEVERSPRNTYNRNQSRGSQHTRARIIQKKQICQIWSSLESELSKFSGRRGGEPRHGSLNLSAQVSAWSEATLPCYLCMSFPSHFPDVAGALGEFVIHRLWEPMTVDSREMYIEKNAFGEKIGQKDWPLPLAWEDCPQRTRVEIF
jgi:hypothetical protein